MLPGSGSQWERGLRYAGSGVEERITTEEARRAVPKERGQRDQRGRSGVPAYRMTRGGVGPGCAYIHLDQSIKSIEDVRKHKPAYAVCGLRATLGNPLLWPLL